MISSGMTSMKMIQKISSPGFHEALTLNEHPKMEMERTKPPSERSALCLPRPIAIPGVWGQRPRRERAGRHVDQTNSSEQCSCGMPEACS